MKKSFAVFLLILAPLSVHAATTAMLSLVIQRTVYQCPPGAQYLLMECKAISDVTSPVQIKMDAVGDDQFQSSWDEAKDGVHFAILATTFTNDYTGRTMSLSVNAGFAAEAGRNAGTYLEFDPAHPPFDFIVDGARKPSGADELVPELTILEIKYTEK